jgi:CheY-like chemotaxis protein
LNSAKALRIHIIDDDPAISLLLARVLSSLGHQVSTFPDPTACPIYTSPSCNCPQDFPCAEVIISDIMMPNMNGIEFFTLQRKRGCKALDANKALMSAAKLTHQDDIKKLGCHFIKKPFSISDIRQWLEECAARIPENLSLANSS